MPIKWNSCQKKANNISLYELKEACQDHGGNRSDEIETNLISQLSKLLK